MILFYLNQTIFLIDLHYFTQKYIKHKYVPGYTPLVNLSHYYVNNRVGVVHERSKATEKLREPY